MYTAGIIAIAAAVIGIFLFSNQYPAPGDIIYNGETYTYNRNLTNVLFLGVDYSVGYTDKAIGGHQADTLVLMSIDKKAKKARFINIPRDVLTQVKAYDANGNFACNTVSPICLAHSFGRDERSGSELTMEAVSYFLYGVPVQNYLSMNIDGITEANDLVGGVPVDVMEDFTVVDPSMVKGAHVTLTGVTAMNYVRQRSLPGMSGSNLDRMNRQIQYMQSFLNQVKEKTRNDKSFPVTLLKQLDGYISTDLTVFSLPPVLNILLDQGVSGGDMQIISGRTTDEGFQADDGALKDLVRDVFYIKQ